MILGIPIIGDFLSKSLQVYRHHLYDFYDRLHFLLTAYILAAFVVLTGAKQHFGHPIDCFLDKQVDDISSWRNYIHNYCLFYGTFRYTVNETGVHYPEYGTKHDVNYYQWVPFFFAFQFFCFIIPHWTWSWMQKLLYLDMEMVVDYTNDLLLEKKCADHNKKLKSLVSYTYDHFNYRRQHKSGYLSSIYMHPALACFLYITTKIMFLANAILQLKLVGRFLGVDQWSWGYEAIQMWFMKRYKLPEGPISVNGRYEMSYQHLNTFHNFPILVGCEYRSLESISNEASHTIQCIIPLNVINEKLFVGLWLWLIVLIGLTVIGTVRWIYKLADKRNSETMMFSLLQMNEFERTGDRSIYTRKNQDNLSGYQYNFIHKFLRSDGVLMVYFMTEKCGMLKTQEVINGLFEKYLKDYETKKQNEAFENDNFSIQRNPKNVKKGEKTDYSEVNFGSADRFKAPKKV